MGRKYPRSGSASLAMQVDGGSSRYPRATGAGIRCRGPLSALVVHEDRRRPLRNPVRPGQHMCTPRRAPQDRDEIHPDTEDCDPEAASANRCRRPARCRPRPRPAPAPPRQQHAPADAAGQSLRRRGRADHQREHQQHADDLRAFRRRQRDDRQEQHRDRAAATRPWPRPAPAAGWRTAAGGR